MRARAALPDVVEQPPAAAAHRWAAGMSVTWKPVPKTIASTSRSDPSAATIERARTSLTPSVTSSTFGLPSARYQRLDGRIRLQPIV